MSHKRIMRSCESRRVVVTGMGIITAVGSSLRSFGDALFQGKCGIGPISLFDTEGFACKNGGQVRAQELKEQVRKGSLRRVSRCDILGLIAAEEAIRDSVLDLGKCDPDKVGVVLGGGAGGMLSWEQYRRACFNGNTRPRPSLLLPSAPCTLTDLIASRYGFSGLRSTITTACSSSATSIGYGYDLISSGSHDIIITGGSEALSELTYGGFNSLRLVDPEYCRPFDRNRQGLSLGEGAAILVLEELGYAAKRDRTPYAEILGYGINSDAYHMTSPDPKGIGMSRVMEMALKNTSIEKHEVDYINAHGTGTKINDITETGAVKNVFGKKIASRIRISSTKSMVGHCLGAAGAVEAVATVLAILKQTAPPTVHLDDPDPACDLDFVPNLAKPCDIRVALSNSFAFGGNNTSLVIGAVS